MRTVLQHTNEVVHYWANAVQQEGRNGTSSVFFNGEWIYSYGFHFCMARHLSNRAVAVTTRTRSSTTARHLSAVLSATRHLKTVRCNDPGETARENMAHARNRIRNCLDYADAPRIRQATRDKHKAEALRIADEANEYLRAIPAVESECQEAIDTTALESVRACLVSIDAARANLIAEQALARRRELDDALTFWRSRAVTVRTGLYSLPAALRLSEDGSWVQTSHGAEIPVEDAIKLWPAILRVMSGSKDYTPGTPIGSYQLTQIRADGSIQVGCHDIAFSEIERIAHALNLLHTTQGV